MKKVWIVLITTAFAFTGMAQTIVTGVSGSVVDAKDAPIEFANIVLMNHQDSSIVKMDVSDMDGKFTINEIPYGDYFLEISYVGYTTFGSPVFSLSAHDKSIILDPIILRDLSINLTGVVVVGKFVRNEL